MKRRELTLLTVLLFVVFLLVAVLVISNGQDQIGDSESNLSSSGQVFLLVPMSSQVFLWYR